MLPGRKYDFDELIQLAKRRMWLLLVPFAVVSATTAVVVRKMPNYWSSDTVIAMVPKSVPDNYVKSTVTTKLEDRLAAIKQTIMSRTRLEALIYEFNLYPEERRNGIMADIVDRMRSNDIFVKLESGSTFRVTYMGRDPLTVKKVTDRLGSMFVEEGLRDRMTLADNTSTFLQSQVYDLRQQLQAADKRVQDYKTKYAGELPTQLDANLQLMRSLQQQMQTTAESISADRNQRLQVQRSISDVETQDSATLLAQELRTASATDTPGNLANATLQQKLAAAESQKKQLLQDGKGEAHPDVKALTQQIASLRQQIQQEALQQPVGQSVAANQSASEQFRQQRLTALHKEMATLDESIAKKTEQLSQMQTQAEGLRARIEAAPQRENEMTDMMRDYSTISGQYQSMLSREQESKVAQSLEERQIGENFKILDSARNPDKPVSPNRPLIILLGMIGGLAIGVGLVLVLELRDFSMRTDDEVARTIGLPVLAVVPLMKSEQERRRARRLQFLLNAGLGSTVVVCLAVLAYSIVR